MKIKIVLFLAVATFLTLVISSYKEGPDFYAGYECTGATGTTQGCNGSHNGVTCHSNNTTSNNVTVVLDSAGTVVKSYYPGVTYTVTLSADGHALSQSFQVMPDPRLKLAPGDLQAQFSLARNVETLRVACRIALKQAKALRKTLSAADTTASKAHDLLARIDTVAGKPGDPFALPAVERHLNTLTDLSHRLDKLAFAADGADAAPTPDAMTSYAQVSAALTDTLKAWAAIQQTAK